MVFFERAPGADCPQAWSGSGLGSLGSCDGPGCLAEAEAALPRPPAYPVNVARNLAKRLLKTPLHLTADIQCRVRFGLLSFWESRAGLRLMPSEHLASRFAAFYEASETERGVEKVVWVVPVFEVADGAPYPRTLRQLRQALFFAAVPRIS